MSDDMAATATIRANAIDAIEKRKRKLNFNTIPLDDKRTWDLICSGFTKGIFQLEKQLGKRYCQEIKPRNINELSDVLSLIRPGCLEAEFREKPDKPGEFSSITNTYIKVKNGEWEPEYIHECLEPIFKDTFTVPIYQEQLMRVCSDFAGFSLKDSDDTRRGIGKKKKEVLEAIKDRFIKGAIAKGHDAKLAETIFGWLEKFSGYGFNKCVSGDTELIRPSSNQHGRTQTVGHLYHLMNSSEYARKNGQRPLRSKLLREGYGKCLALCEDGRIRPQQIKTIHFNGQKEIVLVKDDGGRSIKCTVDHKFMTPNGMLPIGDIGVGGVVLVHHDEYDNSHKYSYNVHDTTERGNPLNLVDTTGRRNSGFIHGHFAALTAIHEQFSCIDTCEICGSRPSRMEWHHVNGDRTINTRENLIKLCVSCHKKEDYKLGRAKKWDKGHQFTFATIVSIEKLGVEDTYDVEMDTAEHNWIANGFVVSNSHGVSYAMIAYRTAYAKANHPLEFFKAMLAFSDSKQDSMEEIRELVFEARYFGINIKPPNLPLGNMDFAKLDSKTIVFGLGHIKGVGESAHKSIETLKGIKKPNELLMAIFDNKVRKDVAEGLIKSGTVDYLGRQRLQLLREFKLLCELTERERAFVKPLLTADTDTVEAAFDTLLNSKVPNKSRKSRLMEAKALIDKTYAGSPKRTAIAWEKQYLGVPLSGSLTDLYHNERVNIKCATLPKLKEGTPGAMGVVIEKVRTIKDKRGQWMAFLSVSDETYMLDNVVVFGSRYLSIGWIIEEGRPVLITGKKNKGSFVVYDITHL